MAGKKGTIRHTATIEEKYAYYIEQYNKKAPKSNYARKTSLIGNIRYFEENYVAVKREYDEKGKRPAWYRIVERLVSNQLYAYSRTSAKAQAKYINQFLDEGEERVSIKKIQEGTEKVSDKVIHEIYINKKEAFAKAWDAINPNYDIKLRQDGYSEEEIQEKIEKARKKYAVKNAHDWISTNIYGSK